MTFEDLIEVFLADNCDRVARRRWQGFSQLHRAVVAYVARFTDLDLPSTGELRDALGACGHEIVDIDHPRQGPISVIYGLNMRPGGFVEPEWEASE